MSPARASVKVLGTRHDPAGHAVRDFLTRIDQPYTWLEPDGGGSEAGRLLAEHRLQDAARPVVVIDDEVALSAPALEELADALGIRSASTRGSRRCPVRVSRASAGARPRASAPSC
jgi:thioredoxin reductase (NADPH)